MTRFRWTGSNTNPNNNAGQGKQGTDRHNVVMLEEPRYEEGSMPRTSLYGQWGLNYPQHLDNTTFLGFNRTDMDTLAFLTSRKIRVAQLELYMHAVHNLKREREREIGRELIVCIGCMCGCVGSQVYPAIALLSLPAMLS